MKKILLVIAMLLVTMSVVNAADKTSFEVGMMYPSLDVVNDHPVNASSIAGVYVEWKHPFDIKIFDLEASTLVGNYALAGDNATANENIVTLTLKINTFKVGDCDIYFGVGAQYASESGYYEFSRDLSMLDSLGNPVSVNQRTRNNLVGGGLSMMFQAGASVPVTFLLNSLSVGVDVKYTPWATSKVDLSNGLVSFDQGVWADYHYANNDITITKLLRGSITVGYAF
jgi:opacity protein-like surface antigen